MTDTTLNPCPDCGAAGTAQLYDSDLIKGTIYICSNHPRLRGGDCSSENAYMTIEAWNSQGARPVLTLVAAAKALLDDVRRRYPAEELHCMHMRNLEAAVNNAEDMSWQPFESAPKDGSDFVAIIPRAKRRLNGRGGWRVVECYWERGLKTPRFIWQGWRNEEEDMPTLWAPLPETVTAPANKVIDQ